MNEWGFNATKEPIAGLLKVIQDFKKPNINSKNYYPSVYWKYLEMLYYLYLPENRHLSDITMDDTEAYRWWKGMEDFPEYMFSLLPSRPIKMKRDFPDAFEQEYYIYNWGETEDLGDTRKERINRRKELSEMLAYDNMPIEAYIRFQLDSYGAELDSTIKIVIDSQFLRVIPKYAP